MQNNKIMIYLSLFTLMVAYVFSGDIVFEDGALTVANLNADDTFYLDDANNIVGIGTTNPVSKMHVYSTTANYSKPLGSQSPILTITGGNANNRMEFGVDTVSVVGSSVNAIQARNTLSGPQRLILNPSGGNIGIGTISPQGVLHLNGSSGTLRLQATGGAYNGQIQFTKSNGSIEMTVGQDISGSKRLYWRNESGSSVMFLTQSGQLYTKNGYYDFTEGVPNDYDALSAIRNVRVDENGKIIHSTLPIYARGQDVEVDVILSRDTVKTKEVFDPDTNSVQTVQYIEEGFEKVTSEALPTRDIGGSISVNVRAIQQLNEEIDTLKLRMAEIEEQCGCSTAIA